MTTRARLGALPRGTARVPPAASSTAFYQFVEVDSGAPFPQEDILNLIGGSGITVVGANDPGNNRTNITISADPMCDHVVKTTADLPAAVAGVRSLTSGSWCFVNDIDLGSDQIAVPAGVTAFLNSEGKRITSTNATATLNVSTATSLANAQGLHFRNTGAGNAVRSVNAGTLYSRFELCMFEAGIAFQQLAGGVIIDTSLFQASTEGILMNDNAGRVIVTASSFRGGAARHINAEIGFSIQVGACYFTDGATGIEFDGDPDHGVVEACQFDSLSSAGIRVLAGMQDCRVIGCDFTLCLTGVSMAVAAVPAGGFTMSGCGFNLNGTNFGAFVATTARVNLKGNVGAAGLLTETPIVP